jgi:ArsR family transcriptional regulator
MELSIIFKTLGDDLRIRILGLLLERELCVCDIESVLEISQVNASRHLSKMKSSGILSSLKTAQWVYYKLSNEFIESYPDLIEYLRIEFGKKPVYKKDIKTLAALKKKNTDMKC